VEKGEDEVKQGAILRAGMPWGFFFGGIEVERVD
jgi:hypothetical protein